LGRPAVDGELRTGGVRRLEAEERHGARDLLDSREALHRVVPLHLLPGLGCGRRGQGPFEDSGVSIGPGLTALTRMPRGVSSRASERTIDRTAALVAA